MKVLLEYFTPMLQTQKDVNKKIAEKLQQAPSVGEYVLAYNVEQYEFINAVGIWKWWKHSHVISREVVLDELADCFAFYLSAALTLVEEIKRDDEITRPRDGFISQSISMFDSVKEGMNEKPEGMSITDYRQGAAKELIRLLGTVSESDKDHINMASSFGILLNIADLVLDDLTWDEIAAAYNKKSAVNKDRQTKNY